MAISSFPNRCTLDFNMRRSKAKFAACLISCAVVALASSLQSDSSRRPFVSLDIVAVDSAGRPVPDLRRDDLRITDNGVTLPVDSVALLYPPVSPDSPGVSTAYANRPPAAAGPSILILLDLLNANLAERGLGFNDLVASLESLAPRDRVYVYLLTKEAKSYPILPLPGDRLPPSQDDWPANIKDRLTRAIRAVNRLRPQDLQVDTALRTQRTYDALTQLASGFAAEPGRKAFVWISHGVPLYASSNPQGNMVDFTAEVHNFAASLARNGIAAYPVDQSDRATQGLESMDTLRELATLSDGVWFGGDLFSKAIAQARSDAPAAYRIRYTPPQTSWDNKFHKLRVVSDRKDVQIRATAGYFADGSQATAAGRLATAALGAGDAQDIGVAVTAAPSSTASGWTHFSVKVDARDLALDSGGHDSGISPLTVNTAPVRDLASEPSGHYSGSVRLFYIEYASEWGPGVAGIAGRTLDLTESERTDLIHHGLSLSFDRAPSADARKVRIVVQDEISGACGAVTVPLGR